MSKIAERVGALDQKVFSQRPASNNSRRSKKKSTSTEQLIHKKKKKTLSKEDTFKSFNSKVSDKPYGEPKMNEFASNSFE